MTSESVDLPLLSEENESIVKPKRLPRSAKKRLRYERIRQQRKEAPKKKTSSNETRRYPIPPSASSTSASEVLNDEMILVTRKNFQRVANERLAAINRETTAPIICIDCAYNESMSGKELASLARQIGRCYSSNRRATKPVQFVLTNWSNDSPLAQQCRRVNDGFDNYKITLSDKPVHESYPPERLIYLSPNAEQTLTEVNEDFIHVIGGLVDESVRKNMTHQACQEKNIVCYKLPIQTYLEHSSSGGTFNQILSINQVFDILLTYLTTKNWTQALIKNVPERKGWVPKGVSIVETDATGSGENNSEAV